MAWYRWQRQRRKIEINLSYTRLLLLRRRLVHFIHICSFDSVQKRCFFAFATLVLAINVRRKCQTKGNSNEWRGAERDREREPRPKAWSTMDRLGKRYKDVKGNITYERKFTLAIFFNVFWAIYVVFAWRRRSDERRKKKNELKERMKAFHLDSHQRSGVHTIQ